jgi:hypothetical protein
VRLLAANVKGTIDFTDTSDVTIGTVEGTVGVRTTGDNTTLSVDSLLLTQDVNLGTGILRLTARTTQADETSINQTFGAITASALGVIGAKRMRMMEAGNDVQIFSGRSQVDDILYTDSNGFTLGVVTAAGSFAGVTGIENARNVELITLANNIALPQALTATETVRLQAELGGISQSGNGVITATDLGVRTAVNSDLNVLVNQVSGTYAANANSTGSVLLLNQPGFGIGTIKAGERFLETIGVNAKGGAIDLTSTAGGMNQLISGVIGNTLSGTIRLDAQAGDIVMTDGITTTSVAGSITYLASGDVKLSSIRSTSGDIAITAGQGSSVVGAISDHTAAETANLQTTGTATLIAETGIGSVDPVRQIETTIRRPDRRGDRRPNARRQR